MKTVFMGNKNCKNCGRLLQPEDNYCPQCGQSAKTKRLQIKQVRKDVFKKFLHADSGILHLTKALAVRPGQAIGDYIAGKRKEYYEPLKYLTFTVGISVLLTTYFDLMLANSADANPVSVFVAKHIDLIFLFSVPIAAAFSYLLFLRKGFNYAEHLALHAFLGGFRTVFFLLVFTPLVVFYRQYYSTILFVYFSMWIAYVAWANIQLMGGPKWLTILKTIAIMLLTQVVISIFIFSVAILYFRH